ncbi:MAG: hypothetical protein AAF702_20740, partial [Chloroflexota bacterium]
MGNISAATSLNLLGTSFLPSQTILVLTKPTSLSPGHCHLGNISAATSLLLLDTSFLPSQTIL